MTPAEIARRHKELVAEWGTLEDQLEDLAELRTWPANVDPAELECQLIARVDEIQDELRVIDHLRRFGELPPGAKF